MRQKGFTMIEILVVIVVFGVGILAILTMLTNSIGYFDTVNMQTRATMLAKEALDLIIIGIVILNKDTLEIM